MTTDGWQCLSPEERLLAAIYGLDDEMEARINVFKERVEESRRQNAKETTRLCIQRRMARKKYLPDDFTAEQMSQVVEVFNGGCALTGEKIYHWDHVVPLSVGHGGTTFGNMIPLRADLNISKSNRNIFEWFEANRQRFNLEQERFDRLIERLGKANGMTVEEYRDYVYECHANPNEINNAEAN